MVTRFIIFLALTLTSSAQPWWTPPVVLSASVEDVCSETIKSHTLVYDSWANFAVSGATQWFFWPITNANAATVCNLSVSQIRDPRFTNGTVSVGIYLTDNGTNALAQVGGNSDALQLSALSTTRTTNTYTWSANKPTLSATNYLLVVMPSVNGNGGMLLALHGSYVAAVAHGCSTGLVIGSVANRVPYYVLSGDVK